MPKSIDGSYQIRFGKYKGEALEDIPVEYLQWLVDNLEPEKFNNEAIIVECQNQIRLKGGEGVAR
jgi:uncharacterized protein (DUF3820 family)